MTSIINTNKVCPKCGKKRCISISDALKVKEMTLAQAEKEFCSCG